MKLRATVAVIVLLCAPTELFAGGSDEETSNTFLLGYYSLDLLYRYENCTDNGSTDCSAEDLQSLIHVAYYIRDLELTVSYPKDPIGENNDAVPLARYGQSVIDDLDEIRRAAFLTGWYGRLAENLAQTDQVEAQEKASSCRDDCEFNRL